MKKVIITGAAGFVGSHVVTEFLKHDITVIAVDIVNQPKNLPLENKKLNYFNLNVSNIQSLPSLCSCLNVDCFIHLAWDGSSGKKRSDIFIQLDNINTMIKCVTFAKKINCPKFICAGSIMEYESLQILNKNTDTSVSNKNSLYGFAKYVTHGLSKYVDGIDICWAMITNTYGPGEFSPRLINTTIRKILADEPLSFSTCTQIYDFIFIDDTAKAFYNITKKGRANKHYILGTNPQPLKEYIKSLINVVNPSALNYAVFAGESDSNLSHNAFISDTFSDGILNKEELTPFEKGIELTTQWIKEQNFEQFHLWNTSESCRRC